MVTPTIVNPPALGRPVGFSHGVRAGDLLFVAGQVGTIAGAHGQRIVSPEFVAQFEQALRNVTEVVTAAGGTPASIVEMTVFVLDLDVYRASREALGGVWKRVMGRHYPAMTLVAVAGLVDDGALVEIRAVAALARSGEA